MININQPGKYDAVIGNNEINTGAAVLGGIEGVKQRLWAPVVEHRIAALTEALNYGQEGLNLVVKALDNPNRFVRVRAYEILDAFEAPEIKVKLNQFRQKHYLIRFNGVYMCESGKHYSYIRFYPDYTVITISAVDTPEKLVKWFNKENCDIYNDIYIVEEKNNIIRFSSNANPGVVDCVANIGIYGTDISLEWFSHLNNLSSCDEYKFIQLSS